MLERVSLSARRAAAAPPSSCWCIHEGWASNCYELRLRESLRIIVARTPLELAYKQLRSSHLSWAMTFQLRTWSGIVWSHVKELACKRSFWLRLHAEGEQGSLRLSCHSENTSIIGIRRCDHFSTVVSARERAVVSNDFFV